MAWMFEEAGWQLNRYQGNRKPGNTTYEEIKGKPFGLAVAEFAEKVRYKHPQTEAEKRGKLEARWGTGIWLGVVPKSHEYIIGTPDGIKTARTVKKVAPSEQWDQELIDSFKGRPW